MDRTPRPGEIYRHFKNKIYQVICIAQHSETGELLVVYQAMYDEFKIYARPLDMFLSEVEHEKYPEIRQKYRFEKINAGSESALLQPADEYNENSTQKASRSENSEKLSEFLDAGTYREKLIILESMRMCMNEALIDSIAISLDLSIRPGTVEEEYGQIVAGLKTLIRFEDTRLR